jgi:hypothetical protein
MALIYLAWRSFIPYGAHIFRMALIYSVWRSYISYGAHIFRMALIYSVWRSYIPYGAHLSRMSLIYLVSRSYFIFRAIKIKGSRKREPTSSNKPTKKASCFQSKRLSYIQSINDSHVPQTHFHYHVRHGSQSSVRHVCRVWRGRLSLPRLNRLRSRLLRTPQIGCYLPVHGP